MYRMGLKEADSRSCSLIMSRYDADQDGRLGFWEFANIFLPVDPNQRREVENRNKIEKISEEAYQRVKNLLIELIQSEGKIEALRFELQHTMKDPLKYIFQTLDVNNRGFLTTNDLM